MKEVRRNNVFETNSSSVHSVTKTSISSDYDYDQVLSMNRNTNRVRVTSGSFG